MNNTINRERPIWIDGQNPQSVKIIDQRRLPHEYIIVDLHKVDDVVRAIKEMYVRGAPLIGVTAAYGVYLAALQNQKEAHIRGEAERIKAARPTAVNLAWAVDRMTDALLAVSSADERIYLARQLAGQIAEEEAENCRKIGENGLALIEQIQQQKKTGEAIHVLTHCNAGWLACVEYGTATAPIYAAHDRGLNIHVWVDETRPLNQGARLTAWELGRYGVKHTLITDNAGGHLMQHGLVDLVIVGTDRTTHTGDVANKIGTYLKALAAKDNGIPFYVALPSSTFDWQLRDGVKEIPIEERDPDEIRLVQGLCADSVCSVLISPTDTPVANIAFDVTPARLVSGFITERGVCSANEAAIRDLFPEKFAKSD
jgi:methylthioribose-1-phosphate isomerase